MREIFDASGVAEWQILLSMNVGLDAAIPDL
jgi:hypothetical protein